MNQDILKLYEIAQKKEKRILGLMSGTSLDGLDMALCKFVGSGNETKIEIEKANTVSFEDDFKQEIGSIFSKQNVDLEMLTILNAKIADVHSRIINLQLKDWKIDASSIDIIASHGQTIFHAPKINHPKIDFGNATLQIGDGDHLAVKTGIITISDFRQKHIAAGGEGAPLAAYGDKILFHENDFDVVLLNIGGIANFSFVPANGKGFFSTDIGPGNTIMDAFVKKNYPNKSFDENGKIAASGNVSSELLNELLRHDFFKMPFPKTTGPEVFNLDFLANAISNFGSGNLNLEDILSTLNQFTAQTIIDAISKINARHPIKIYASGGGFHNDILMSRIKTGLPNVYIGNTSEKGIDPDFKEAVLFAVLANETLCGAEFSSEENELIPVMMGKISLPH